MSVPPYTKGKPIEAGALATRKQDFNSHVSGGAFYHSADSIMMTPPPVGFEQYTSVQALLSNLTLAAGGHGATVTIGIISDPQNAVIGDVNIGDPNITELGQAITFILEHISSRFTQLTNGGTIFIKAGNYTIKTPIVLKSGISLVGELGGTNINLSYTNISYPPIRINNPSTSYTISDTPTIYYMHARQTTYIKDIQFINYHGHYTSGHDVFSYASLFTLDSGANVVFDNVSLFGGKDNAQITHSFINISGTTNNPPTVLKINNCYIDCVNQVIDTPNMPIDQLATINITNCLFRIFGDSVPGIASIPCNCTIANNTFVRVSDSSLITRSMFILGYASNLTGNSIIMSAHDNIGYTTSSSGVIQSHSDGNFVAITPAGYIYYDSNNNYAP